MPYRTTLRIIIKTTAAMTIAITIEKLNINGIDQHLSNIL